MLSLPAVMPCVHTNATSSLSSISNKTISKRACIDNALGYLPILHKITAYTPSPALLITNRTIKNQASNYIKGVIIYLRFLVPCGLVEKAPHFQKGQPDFQSIGQNLSQYSKMIGDEYEKQISLFKEEDYTPRIMAQTLPFRMFPTEPLYYLFSINWHWSAFAQKQEEVKALSLGCFSHLESNAYKKIKYFFLASISNGTDLNEIWKSKFKGIKDANKLLKYISDQVYSVAKTTMIYDETLYDVAIALLKSHDATQFSYEILHYVLLIHIHTLLTSHFVKNNKFNKLHLINLLLTYIKSKNIELVNLENQLKYLLVNTDPNKILLNEKDFKKILTIINKHFSKNNFKTIRGCVIS